jgi:hypothetical protein
MEQPLDGWDSNAADYHKNFANATNYGGTPYAYGLSDMNYYGGFVNACGGSFWRPYFAGAAWDPYGSGAWAYYAGAGYSWVSPYPWGWTPYHSGAWSFCQGVGWGWMPGGAWMGLNNYAFANTGAQVNRFPTNHPRPPVAGPPNARATFVPVNMKEVPASSLSGEDKFVFRNNSAGMGVPRGTLGKLGGYSNHVAQHGSASTSVYSYAPAPRGGPSGQTSSVYSAAGRAERSDGGHMQSSMGSSSMHSSMQSAPSAAPSGGGAGGGGGGHR